ncbi:hypothetical protein GA0070607_0060 [Micromonospora coriariae]|uniref:Uncharacterized protein n=1 Tax=Micromonospora coriariae TaxID=285665 RepID=A0A1C4U2N2_9ACTN|nr:hypothetical protein GA0070607_0060 [Micromonospora coriariae]
MVVLGVVIGLAVGLDVGLNVGEGLGCGFHPGRGDCGVLSALDPASAPAELQVNDAGAAAGGSLDQLPPSG